MAKKLMSVTVKGRQHEWNFQFYGEEKSLKEWAADDVEVAVVENTIPVWVADLGLTRLWCFCQDVFNFKNPFKET